ncbi:MAG TPA: glucokinase, partial [Rhodanobacteraceae bacterium]|nr:glucokinase [Rhodanobacteraceae bacterium]
MGGARSQGELARARATLIAADVGGTHARVALLEAEPGAGASFAILEYRKYACADHPSLGAILDDFRAAAGGGCVDRIALALAGYVIDDVVVNVNLPWTVSVSALRESLGVAELAIVNDFEAVAHAIGHIDAAGATLLSGPAEAALPGPMLVVGPGTGLGAALRIPHVPRPVVLATEAGQATLAPGTDREIEILKELRRHSSRVQIEQVLSGGGLVNLHRAIAALRGESAPQQTPAAITAAALARE